jgi:hypothetical protein
METENKTIENCAHFGQDQPRPFDARRSLTRPMARNNIPTAVWNFMAAKILRR